MPAAVVLTVAYLAIGFVSIVWIARAEARGRPVSARAAIVARSVVYGPPLLGLGYLVTIARDWPFFLLVVAFFVIAFLLLSGLLNTPSRPPR